PAYRRGFFGIESRPERYRLLFFSRVEDLLAAVGRRMGDAVIVRHEAAALETLGACRRLKADDRAGDLPLLVTGSIRDQAEAMDLMAAGVDELLPDGIDGAYARARLDVWLRMRARLASVARAKRRLQETADFDRLTNVGNRAAFDRWIQEAMGTERRRARKMALILIDVDHFKQINDGHGHPFGDRVLRDIAALMKDRLRDEDQVARYGGDEFAILAEGPDPQILARSLLRRVRAHPFEHRGKPIRVTLSIGVAERDHATIETPEDWIAAADQALYAAKEAGRDRAELYRPMGRVQVLDIRDLERMREGEARPLGF
ncbi:MAG: GGDEF domain-containing protein, partial [Myxococcales bacterium]|nr:GGDEF domain-containing protein [Myxococcales bacterium]